MTIGYCTSLSNYFNIPSLTQYCSMQSPSSLDAYHYVVSTQFPSLTGLSITPTILFEIVQKLLNRCDDAEILTSEVHDPYARTTGARK